MFTFRDHPTVRVANAVRGDRLRVALDDYLSAVPWIALTATSPAVSITDGAGLPVAGQAVAVLAAADDEAGLRCAVGAGAPGLILADDPLPDFLRAVHDVACHGGWISPRLASRIVAMARPQRASAQVQHCLETLTGRERETLRLLAQGMENAQIAAGMFVTVSAVKYHISNLLRKLGCRDRTQLVALAYQTGLGTRAQSAGA